MASKNIFKVCPHKQLKQMSGRIYTQLETHLEGDAKPRVFILQHTYQFVGKSRLKWISTGMRSWCPRTRPI